MFEPSANPRVFGTAPGVDFPAALVQGLLARSGDLSTTTIFVNTARMRRRVQQLLQTGPARILPRIRLVTDLGTEAALAGIPPAVAPLRRRLELAQLVGALLDADPTLAPRSALFDLSDSLASLFDEMQGEGVPAESILSLDVTDQSGHWQRAIRFLSLLRDVMGDRTDAPDTEARQRLVVTALCDSWQAAPPSGPIIIAGSTGSRGTTRLLMEGVARLPQGALILPGFDFDMPSHVWSQMDDALTFEDHPQFRFHTLLSGLGMTHADVGTWSGTAPAADRNALVSLSLRPAPVTDQWRTDGPGLGDLGAATQDLTLIEAENPRQEAVTIALGLRQAAAAGKTAALITPDRMLTRQVAAALDRWDIVPDDSAGTPLAQSAAGRFLRQIGEALGQAITAEALLALLKHPLANSAEDRNMHLLRTRRLELAIRRQGIPFPAAEHLSRFADASPQSDTGVAAWVQWIGEILADLPDNDEASIGDHLNRHIRLAERLSAGPTETGSGALWNEKEGRAARQAVDQLERNADAGGILSLRDYLNIFGAVLSQGTVRDRDAGDPRILIWGTLEARVGGADVVILGGLNEGTWPETPSPDPWLNRKMRASVGLLLPERRIGLSAHDYQQAVCAPEVWISRARRSADAETVPSRWINRLTNLLDGLPNQNGPQALAKMRARGNELIAQAATFDTPDQSVPRATRPSPKPPAKARPELLSVTQIKTLIRDPFSIYAQRILGLRPLDPLQRNADAPLRGEIYHKIFERFIRSQTDPRSPDARAELLKLTQEELLEQCPWPTVRLQWLTRVEAFADGFLLAEALRQDAATPKLFEQKATIAVDDTGVTLSARSDRIDRTEDGRAIIYDYKSGRVPTKPEQQYFDKQLLLTAAMVEKGAFDQLGQMVTADAQFLSLNKDLKVSPAPLADEPPDVVWTNFVDLIRRWQDPGRGYTARMAMQSKADFSAYDHLSRFGEWETSDPAVPEDMS